MPTSRRDAKRLRGFVARSGSAPEKLGHLLNRFEKQLYRLPSHLHRAAGAACVACRFNFPPLPPDNQNGASLRRGRSTSILLCRNQLRAHSG